jgi:hypothetical protein
MNMLKKSMLLTVSLFVAAPAFAALDMTKFQETMAKINAAVTGSASLLKDDVQPMLQQIKQTVDGMNGLVAQFKSTTKTSAKMDIIAKMNTLLIADLQSLANFISNIGTKIIANIDQKPAQETQKVVDALRQVVSLTEQMNNMISSLSGAVATFE